ncbi:hypothetical protein KOR42_12720 [Thalassoglobus neptunius]|uniref:Phosphatidate phosphatase APP1 catalytic domain-containing protein n=1 Tax=Thalassoglobus neptunius TaxID=1938619 RepID=A0A5C5X6Y0_9PLAN|nr:phosphatase domain-containing protein [Thalassoglobus neptunius]TWT57905.1 hypothetical protein KOR42_12720 [Thalassoglobus neptunius]
MAESIPVNSLPGIQERSVRARESVVFFRSYAFYSPAGKCWHLEIHGKIYAPTRRHIRKTVLLHLFKRVVKPEKDAQIHRLFRDRADLFLNVSKANISVPIAIAEQAFVLPKSSPDGHFRTTVTVPQTELEPSIQVDQFGRRFVQLCVHLPEDDDRFFAGEVELISPEGVSVISDIDDTIKVTNVADRRELLANTFTREFQAVPGMPETYQRLASLGTSFHYVSSSPWPLYDPLVSWLDKDAFPTGSLHLRNVRLSELRKNWKRQAAYESKRKTIETLLRSFSARQFVLCGDSGERDAELYAEIAERFRDQVSHVAIRYLSDGYHRYSRAEIAARFSNLSSDRWSIFESPEELDWTSFIGQRSAS